MDCKQCGAQIPDYAKFCTECGNICNREDIQQVSANQQQAPTSQIVEEPVVADKYVPCPVPALPKKEKKFLKNFVSVLCCIMIFVFSFATLTVFTVRGSITPDRVDNLVDDFDIKYFLEESGIGEDMDEVYIDQIEEICEKSFVRKYIKDVANEYTGYILGGRKPKGVKSRDVIKLISDNRYEVQEIFEYEIEDDSFGDVEIFFGENGEENLGVFSSEVRTNDELDTARMLLSVYMLIGLLIFVALFVFLLYTVRKGNTSFMAWTGVTFISVAVIFGIFTSIRPIILGFMPNADVVVYEIVRLYLKNSLSVVLLNSFAMLAVGFLLVLTHIIVKKCIQKTKKI